MEHDTTTDQPAFLSRNSVTAGEENAVYRECGEWDNYERGNILDRNGRYKVPIAAETGKECMCPTCMRPWPEAPDVKLAAEDNFLWVEGKVVPIKWKSSLATAEVLLESFGRFLSRDKIRELAFSDVPDCDVPDLAALTKALCYLRGRLEGTNVCVQNKPGHGYRLTTVDIANAFDKRERDARRTPRAKRTKRDGPAFS